MRIYVDSTEPGVLLQKLRQQAERGGIPVERTILHKRENGGPALTREHPFYGYGCDFVIADDSVVCVAAIERKTLDDLARSLSVGQDREGSRLFRQLTDLARHPMPLLILEGSPNYMYRHFEPALLGFQFWCARNGIAIMYSTSLEATAKAVHLMTRKLGQSYDSKAGNDLTAFLRAAEARPIDADERPSGYPERGA
jgi:hypothetical protein